jgi:hypothetical protein
MKTLLAILCTAVSATSAETFVATRTPGFVGVYAGGARHVYDRVEFFCDGTFSKCESRDATSRDYSGTYQSDGRSVFLRYTGADAHKPDEEFVSVAVGGTAYLVTPGMWKIFEESQRKSRPSLLPLLWSMSLQMPNKAPEPATMAVTPHAPSSASRARHGRGSS